MDVVFDHKEEVVPQIQTFWFRPLKSPMFIAGQFTELYLPHDNSDNYGQRRWFTLSSSPLDDMLSITTRFTSGHDSTFKQTLKKLQPGTPLKLAEPMGDFVLPKDPRIPLVFVAGGIGITPVHSMIKFLHDTQEQRDIRLIYAVGTLEELAFVQLFKEYGSPYTPVVKRPPDAYIGEVGSLDASRVLALAPDSGKEYYYMSGPEVMVETLTKDLAKMGVPAQRLISDYFPGYQQF